jgi:hypothetical protein
MGMKEYIADGAALGRDIQYVFTDSAHIERVRDLLRSQGHADIRVLDIDAIRAYDVIKARHADFHWQADHFNQDRLRRMLEQVGEYLDDRFGPRGP